MKRKNFVIPVVALSLVLIGVFALGVYPIGDMPNDNSNNNNIVGSDIGYYGEPCYYTTGDLDRKSTRLNSSHTDISRMPSSA